MTNLVNTSEMLQEKLTARIAADTAKGKVFLDKIEQDGKLLNDFILPLGYNKHVLFYAEDVDNALIDTTSKIHMRISNSKTLDYGMHPHAVVQTALKLGANGSYAKNLVGSKASWQVELAAHILNEHSLHTTRQRALVREVGGEVRGFLSDEYRRLDSPILYNSFISAAKKAGGVISSAYADDTRGWIEVLIPQVIDIATQKNGTVTIAYGMRLATSDFGDGALELRAFMIQVVCYNGMVRNSILRQIHLGRKIPDNIELSKQTYLYDTKTQASLIGDAVKQLMNRDSIVKIGTEIQKASEMSVDFDAEFKRLNKTGMLKNEVEQVKTIITNNKLEDGVQGENTLWKLAQGVGAVANKATDRRKRELMEISGELMNRIK